MPSPLWPIPFLVLAGAGYYGLWVVGTDNGLFAHLEGTCAPTGLARSSYIGFKPVDDLLCILVTFFMNGLEYPPLKPFISLFSSLFLVPLVLVQIASHQPGQSPVIRYTALITGLACQAFGAGVALPVWYAAYALFGKKRGGEPSGTGGPPYFLAFFLANIIPGYLMIDPDNHLKPYALTKRTVQNITAFWQPFPLWVAILLLVIPISTSKKTTVTSFKIFTSLNYYLALFGFYKMAHELYGGDLLEAFKATVSVPLYSGTIPQKSHLFLLFDFLSVWVSTGLWVLSGRREGVTASNIAGYIGSSVILGPGTAVLRQWETPDLKGKKVL